MSDVEEGSHELSPLIQQLAQSFGTVAGEPTLSEQSLERFQALLREAPEAEHDDLIAELMVLAILMQRESGERAERAIEQLALLAAALIGEEAAAALMGVDPSAAHAKVTGADQASKVPVGAGSRPAGAVDPFSLRLGQGAPAKKKP